MLLKAREGALAARLASLLAFALFFSFAASAQDAGDDRREYQTTALPTNHQIVAGQYPPRIDGDC